MMIRRARVIKAHPLPRVGLTAMAPAPGHNEVEDFYVNTRGESMNLDENFGKVHKSNSPRRRAAAMRSISAESGRSRVRRAACARTRS